MLYLPEEILEGRSIMGWDVGVRSRIGIHRIAL